MAAGQFYYRSKKLWLKEDASMRQGSQRLKEHFPKEVILKLENFTFTRQQFISPRQQFISPMQQVNDQRLKQWVNGVKQRKSQRYYFLRGVNPPTPQGKYLQLGFKLRECMPLYFSQQTLVKPITYKHKMMETMVGVYALILPTQLQQINLDLNNK